MTKGPPEKPLMPFAPAPSARPPSTEEGRVQVRVPAPGRAPDLSPLPMPVALTSESSGPVFAHAPTEHAIEPEPAKLDTIPSPPAALVNVAEEGARPEPAAQMPMAGQEQEEEEEVPASRPINALPPPAPPAAPAPPEVTSRVDEAPEDAVEEPSAPVPRPEKRQRVLLAAAVAGAALLVGGRAVVLVVTLTRATSPVPREGTTTRDEPAASASATTTTSSPSASSSPPMETPSASAPSASATSSARPLDAGPQLKPFDRAAARKALEALTPKLAACKVTKAQAGQSTRVVVVFAPSGTVSSVTTAAPLTATPQATCAATTFKRARVAPFSGAPASYVHVFALPH